MYELVRVGYNELVGEIIRLEGEMATIQVIIPIANKTLFNALGNLGHLTLKSFNHMIYSEGF